MKLIVDLIYKGGFKYMRYSISDTAEFGIMKSVNVSLLMKPRRNEKVLLKSKMEPCEKLIMENKMGRLFQCGSEVSPNMNLKSRRRIKCINGMSNPSL